MQHGLRLTGPQTAKVLTARRCLLDKLRKVGLERRQLLSALGLQLLQTPQEKWAQSVPVQRLQNNLGQERAAASAFLFSTIDEVNGCLIHTTYFENHFSLQQACQISLIRACDRMQLQHEAGIFAQSSALTVPQFAQGLSLHETCYGCISEKNT